MFPKIREAAHLTHTNLATVDWTGDPGEDRFECVCRCGTDWCQKSHRSWLAADRHQAAHVKHPPE